eukprot:4206263-Ditylum_brightwellii.AAC.1
MSPIIDVRVADSDAKSSLNCTIEDHLKAQETKKKKKYIHHCQQQRKNFTPFVVTVDEVLGQEASMILKEIAHALIKKWLSPLPQTQNYVNTMISIAIVRATHRCLRELRSF